MQVLYWLLGIIAGWVTFSFINAIMIGIIDRFKERETSQGDFNFILLLGPAGFICIIGFFMFLLIIKLDLETFFTKVYEFSRYTKIKNIGK